MSSDVAARASLAFSLAFHIVFAAVGIGLPVMFCIAEGIGLRKRDPIWYRLARRWSRAAGILFVVGAVSGTALSFEFGLLWPRFMAFGSSIFGLMFTFEGFCFFLEAIFLGSYLYGWDRLSPRTHWLVSFPVVITGALASLFVVAVNSWMNTPTGFQLVNGKAVNIDPWAAHVQSGGTRPNTSHAGRRLSGDRLRRRRRLRRRAAARTPRRIPPARCAAGHGPRDDYDPSAGDRRAVGSARCWRERSRRSSLVSRASSTPRRTRRWRCSAGSTPPPSRSTSPSTSQTC